MCCDAVMLGAIIPLPFSVPQKYHPTQGGQTSSRVHLYSGRYRWNTAPKSAWYRANISILQCFPLGLCLRGAFLHEVATDCGAIQEKTVPLLPKR